MKPFLFYLFILLSSTLSFSQKGKDGDLVVSSQIQINTYTYLTDDATTGDNYILVSSNLLSGSFFSNPLTGGDLIFIYQAQGADMKTDNDEGYGELVNINGAGCYDLVQVSRVSGSDSIFLDCPISHDYSSSGSTQIVRVPRLNSLEIEVAGELTCQAWNGQTGGAILLEVKSEMIVDGSINADGKGFRGGGKENILSNRSGFDFTGTNLIGGRKGEGVSSYIDEYGRGAALNGGGGGNALSAGGGGGASITESLDNYFGYGLANSFITGAQAWQLESQDLVGLPSIGGGRGGYAQAENDLNALVVGPNDVNWGLGNRNNSGGLGGRPLTFDSERIFMSGGGGAGANEQGDSGSGGSGGGLIYIQSFDDVSGSGLISANGADGEDAGFAAGGGGAGGTILINSRETISDIQVEAIGGNGGNQIGNSIACGPGGGGTGGLICLSNDVSNNVNGGNSGTTDSDLLSEFPVNGSTDGNDGLIKTDLTNYQIIGEIDTICKGSNIIQVAQFEGSLPPGSNIEWYDAPFGGNLIQVGNSISIQNIQNDTTVYLSVCPSSYRESYGFYVDRDALAEAGNDTLTCPNTSLQLSGSGGIQFTWEPAEFLDNASISNPNVSISSSQMFYLEIVAENGCSDRDSVFVDYVDELDLTTNGSATICYGEEHILSVQGANNYTWSGSQIISNQNDSIWVKPLLDTIYHVVGTNNAGCIGYDSISVNVHDEIIYNLTNDTTICDNNCITLSVSMPNAGFGEFRQIWNDNVFTSGLLDCIDQDTTHYIEIQNNFTGCVIEDSTVILLSQINHLYTSQDLCLGSVIQLQDASQSASGSITSILWDFDNGESQIGLNFNYTFPDTGYYAFQVLMEDTFDCDFTFTDSIYIYPSPEGEILTSDLTMCQSDSILLWNSNFDLDSVSWWSNGLKIGDSDSLFFNETTEGTYDITSFIWDNACLDTVELNSPVVINPRTIADFSIAQGNDTIRPLEIIEVINNSDAESYEWSFQGEQNTDQNPEFMSEIEGDFCLTLVTNNSFNCRDTFTYCFPVYDNLELITTNSLTPNNDGFNDLWIIEGTQQFTLIVNIYDRWGGLVYSSKDYENDFDGTANNGELLEGTYFYVITAVENPEVKKSGYIQVFR